MGMVDFTFYSTVYMGTDADNASFPALCARASDVIGAVTHWADEATISKLPVIYQNLYKKAICAQIDFLAINGMDTLNESGSDGGWTVGKVTVHGKTGSTGGKMAESISALAIGYLEQTGLMNPNIPTIEGWW